MMKMLTLCGKQPKDMNKDEIVRELHAQKTIYKKMKMYSDTFFYKAESQDISLDDYEAERVRLKEIYDDGRMTYKEYFHACKVAANQLRCSSIRWDKAKLFQMYRDHLEALIDELSYYKDRRAYDPKNKKVKNAKRKADEKERLRLINQRRATMHKFRDSIYRDGINLSWDKDKFLKVAHDRGYQTDEAIAYSVEKELNLDHTKVEVLMRVGRFTWGQVLCLGAMLQMTPKEFCDVFLSGYFVEQGQEYIASYDNIDKDALLKRAIKPSKAE